MKTKKGILLTILVVIISIFIYIYFFLPVPSFDKGIERLYLKEVGDSSTNVKWFYYSTVASDSPDYIIINKGKNTDTICSSNNIANLELTNGKVIIGFFGKPKLHNKLIEIPNEIMNFQVVVDSTFERSSSTEPRKFYKKPKIE